MAQLLVLTRGLKGLLYASLELARRLEADGHSIHVATLKPSAEAVAAYGFPYTALNPAVSPETVPPRQGSWWQAWRTQRARRQRIIDQWELPRFAALLDEVNPDLLLIDFEMHPYLMLARARGVHTAQISTFFSIYERPGLPLMHTDTVPGVGEAGTPTAMTQAWRQLQRTRRRRRLQERFRRAGGDRVSMFRHVAEQVGFSFEGEVDFDQWVIPLTYRTIPHFSLHAQELDLPHDPHPAHRYLGPMVSTQRASTHAEPGVDERLQALYEGRSQDPTSRLILCTLSTFISLDARFMRQLVEMARLRSHWTIILSVGGLPTNDVTSLSPPANLHVFSWLPTAQVLAQADAMIMTAGTNTINEALQAGVPSVVYSVGKNNQEGNAARVAFHRLGVVGSMQRDDALAIAGRVEEALTDATLHANIASMQRVFARYTASRHAERLIADYLATGPQA
ncbi:MAG: nucleotide disphospho-sugar-binding domain-containing protein [Bacteroidota bacterium]